MISQIQAFTRQVPLLYVLGNANSIALAYTHYNVAPKLLTLIVPIPAFLVCLYRLSVWFRTRTRTFTAASAQARLRSTVLITGLLGVAYALWAVSLYPYGDAYQRCHVAFFMATTAIGSIFCLMHLRSAALLLTAAVFIPFFARFFQTSEPVLTAMAIDLLLTVIVMIFISSRFYDDFVSLVHSQKTLEALNDENLRFANQDSLTGLPNRRSFFADLSTIFALDAHERGSFALGLVDLDGFKPVNDVFGHAGGDLVLIEVGRRLRETLGPTALVARLGGDEFGLLLALPDPGTNVLEQGEKVCQAIRNPIQLPAGTARVAASIGFALATDSAVTWAQLMERADYALYRAKAMQLGTPVLFSEQHELAIRFTSRVEQELRRADFESEMHLKFQPLVEVATGRTIAYEALARWSSPSLGEVAPMEFIGAAERMGVITHLTSVLFKKALAAMRHWPEDIDLSFNLSVWDLSCGDTVARLATILRDSGIPARRISLEITETALIKDFDQARDTLLRFKELGANISLDDFGTGYSSLSYVHRLPLDKIKIDRGFVRDITTDRASVDIVKSILDLCRNLKITCVVEGVETAEQVLILRALGCSTMQGFYFGRPIDNEALLGKLAPADVGPESFSFWCGEDLALRIAERS